MRTFFDGLRIFTVLALLIVGAISAIGGEYARGAYDTSLAVFLAVTFDRD